MGKKLNKSSGGPTDGEKTDNTSVDKKIDKKKKFKKKKPTGPSVAKLPGSKTEYSANWKQMLLTIEKDKKPAAKPLFAHSKSFRDKRSKESSAKAAKNTIDNAKKPDIWFDVKDDTLLDPEDRPTAEVFIFTYHRYLICFFYVIKETTSTYFTLLLNRRGIFF